MAAFLGTIYATLQLKTNEFSSAIATAQKDMGGMTGTATKVSKAFVPIGLAAGAAFAYAGKQAMDFETQLSNISTVITGDATQAVNTMRDGILAMVKEIPKSPEDLGASAYDIFSAGITDTSKALQVLESSAKLATTGLSTTEEATDIMTSAINAFGLDASNSAAIADVLFKTVNYGKTTVAEMSQAFGATAPIIAAAKVSLEEFSAATAALTTTGMPAAQAQNSLRQAVVSLSKPTADMNELLKKAGYESGQAALEQDGLVKVMQAVDKAAGGNAESLGKAWGSVEALGAATSLVGPVNKAFTSTMFEMTDGANAIEDAFAKQKATTASSLQLLKNELNAIAITIGSKVLPYVAKFAQWISSTLIPAISKLVMWLNQNRIVLAIVGGIIGAVLVTAFVSWAVAAGAAAIATLAALWPILLIGAAIGAIAYLVITHWETIKNALSVAWEFIVGVFNGAITWIKENWDKLLVIMLGPLGLFIAAVIKNWDTIKSTFITVVTAIKDFFVGAFNWIKDKVEWYIGIYVAAFNLLRDGAVAAWNWIKDKAVGVFNAVKDTISGVINAVVGWFKDLPGNIASGLSTIGNTITAPFKAAFNAVAGFWNNTVGKISFTAPDWVPGIGGKGFSMPTIPLLASGGIVTRPTLAMIGEGNQAEAVLPLSKLSSLMSGDLPSMRSGVGSVPSGELSGSGGVGTVINVDKIELPNVENADDFAREMKLKFASMRGI